MTIENGHAEAVTLANGGPSGSEKKAMSGLQGLINQYVQPQRDENRFRLTTFDQLINPLRVDNPFGNIQYLFPT